MHDLVLTLTSTTIQKAKAKSHVTCANNMPGLFTLVMVVLTVIFLKQLGHYRTIETNSIGCSCKRAHASV